MPILGSEEALEICPKTLSASSHSAPVLHTLLVVAGEDSIAGEPGELLRLTGVGSGEGCTKGGAEGGMPAGARKQGGYVHQPCGRGIHRITGR